MCSLGTQNHFSASPIAFGSLSLYAGYSVMLSPAHKEHVGTLEVGQFCMIREFKEFFKA